jgi:hypothetical protein
MSGVVVPELLVQGALSFVYFALWTVFQSVIGRRLDERAQRFVSMAAFAFAGWLTLFAASGVSDGVILDQRGAIIGLASAYAGLAGGAATAAVCALTRWWQNGQGAVAGLLGIAADLAVAVVVVQLAGQRSGWAAALKLLVLGIAVGATEAGSLALIPPSPSSEDFFADYGAKLLLVQLVGTLLFGGLIEIAEDRKRQPPSLHDRLFTLDAVLQQTVDAFGKATAAAAPYAGHEARVAALAVALGVRCGLTGDRLRGLAVAAKIHNIGQLRIPADILLKPSRLSSTEFELVKQHADAGWELLQPIAFPWPVADIVHQHHENYDGSGYPKGLAGDGILLEARILRVADTLEALCSHRPFRAALPLDQAVERLRELSGTTLDGRIVERCLALIAENEYRPPDPPDGAAGWSVAPR